MAEEWPSPHHHEAHPLPRVEDLPAVGAGYDREQVQAAFDVFYRHIARLDATLRTLEAVEVFRGEASDLRAELRSLRAAGWSPYPRGYALTPERSMLGSVPEAVPRIALEVIFLVVVAAVVAVAKLSALEIIAVMAGAVLITFLVELIAARERRPATPIPAAPPAVAPVAAPPPSPTSVEVVRRQRAAVADESTAADEDVADDGSGWAAFAEPASPEAVVLMGALAVDEEQPVQDEEQPMQEDVVTPEESVPPEPDPEPEPELETAADVDGAETGVIARSRFLRRKQRAATEPEPAFEPASKHVRVLPQPETAVAEAELPPWERGFDDTEERRP